MQQNLWASGFVGNDKRHGYFFIKKIYIYFNGPIPFNYQLSNLLKVEFREYPVVWKQIMPIRLSL